MSNMSYDMSTVKSMSNSMSLGHDFNSVFNIFMSLKACQISCHFNSFSKSCKKNIFTY